MKHIAFAVLFAFGAVAHGSASAEEIDLQLEPCINSDVSAGGLYPTQAQEDRAQDVALDATREQSKERGRSTAR